MKKMLLSVLLGLTIQVQASLVSEVASFLNTMQGETLYFDGNVQGTDANCRVLLKEYHSGSIMFEIDVEDQDSVLGSDFEGSYCGSGSTMCLWLFDNDKTKFSSDDLEISGDYLEAQFKTSTMNFGLKTPFKILATKSSAGELSSLTLKTNRLLLSNESVTCENLVQFEK